MKYLQFCTATVFMFSVAIAAENSPVAKVDSSTLNGRVMTGYQAWFRCPGDAFDQGWYHWSRRRDTILPDTLTVELFPDVSIYPPSELFAVPNFTHPDGSQAYLFSSESPVVVQRHFELMQEYGIDGVWLLRFIVCLPGAGPLAEDFFF
ncbi:MAG: hypothetical protein LBI05_11560, partial [Planctomycetaceae bacterium]|jgi:hypothetical protein|nr:hypothetical protein [Planctomycetaceae bacterium]